jgi:glycosyltransferase involved in cell wall biosynthesis
VPSLPSQREPLPSVGVVVPCYNYGRYLRGCVDSVLGQAGVEVRVLIVDDASTDDSASIAAALAAADARVELRVHTANHGHLRTYNEGLRWVTGTYAVLLDADDMLTPGALRRACELLHAHPEVGFVYGRPLVFREGRSHPPPWTGRTRWTIWPGREWLERCCRTTENCIRSPEVVVRTATLRQVGDYCEDLPHSADFELWMRLALHADVGYVAGPHQAYYRDHPASMHRQRFGSELADLAQIAAAFEVLFRTHGQLIADRQRLEEIVRHRLAQRAIQAACRAYDRGEWRPGDAAGLEKLAVTIYPGAHALADMRGLRWRRQLGPRTWRRIHPYLLFAQRLHGAVTRRWPRAFSNPRPR